MQAQVVPNARYPCQFHVWACQISRHYCHWSRSSLYVSSEELAYPVAATCLVFHILEHVLVNRVLLTSLRHFGCFRQALGSNNVWQSKSRAQKCEDIHRTNCTLQPHPALQAAQVSMYIYIYTSYHIICIDIYIFHITICRPALGRSHSAESPYDFC